jgi:ArsR family transcriptional regulator, lead/cadmium/zinc/bismuth-responsive transcriptional repressor
MARETCDLLCLNLDIAEGLRRDRLDFERAERLAGEAKALSDPTRLTLVAALGGAEELCVCDMAWVMERAENLVSHHLRVLRGEGLVTRRRDGKMVMYALTDRGRELAGALLTESQSA